LMQGLRQILLSNILFPISASPQISADPSKWPHLLADHRSFRTDFSCGVTGNQVWYESNPTWSCGHCFWNLKQQLLPRKFKTAYQNSQPFSAREFWILREIWTIKLSLNSNIKTKPIFLYYTIPTIIHQLRTLASYKHVVIVSYWNQGRHSYCSPLIFEIIVGPYTRQNLSYSY